ncbi:MAG: hypothetical protein JNJ41_02295 [Bacteroidia bacterium]|nr:hypothetical protein [Bacteroidia bacterium]
MKKALVLLSIVAFVSSCKKQRSCECVSKVTATGPGFNSTKEITQRETFTEKMKDKTATSACSTVEAQTKKHVEEQVKDAYNGTGISPSVSTSCKLL